MKRKAFYRSEVPLLKKEETKRDVQSKDIEQKDDYEVYDSFP